MTYTAWNIRTGELVLDAVRYATLDALAEQQKLNIVVRDDYTESLYAQNCNRPLDWSWKMIRPAHAAELRRFLGITLCTTYGISEPKRW